VSRDEIRQVADWLVEHGFTVYVDYEAERLVIELSERPG
jgi:hypothetical protein